MAPAQASGMEAIIQGGICAVLYFSYFTLSLSHTLSELFSLSWPSPTSHGGLHYQISLSSFLTLFYFTCVSVFVCSALLGSQQKERSLDLTSHSTFNEWDVSTSQIQGLHLVCSLCGDSLSVWFSS